MGVETGVAKLGDLLCEKLNSVGRVAEDDRLVDLELGSAQSRSRRCKRAHFGEEGVQTVDFLSFFDIGIVLGNTLQRELVHEVDLERLDHVSVLVVS